MQLLAEQKMRHAGGGRISIAPRILNPFQGGAAKNLETVAIDKSVQT
jgi:hypothetical protein